MYCVEILRLAAQACASALGTSGGGRYQRVGLRKDFGGVLYALCHSLRTPPLVCRLGAELVEFEAG